MLGCCKHYQVYCRTTLRVHSCTAAVAGIVADFVEGGIAAVAAETVVVDIVLMFLIDVNLRN